MSETPWLADVANVRRDKAKSMMCQAPGFEGRAFRPL